MNALEFRLLLYKKQNYSYTFFKLGMSEILSFVEKLRVDVYDEDKIIKVYCADQNTLDTCYQAAVSVVSYQPIIIDKTNIKLVSKNTAELVTPYPSYIDGTSNCNVKTADFVQVYTLEKSLINPLMAQTLKFSFNSGLSAGGVIFPDDCQSLTPGFVLGAKDKFTMTLDEVGNIAMFLVGNLISDIQSSNCSIHITGVTTLNGNLQMDITSVVSSMSVVTPRTIDACYLKVDEKLSAIISWASAVNPEKINDPIDTLSAKLINLEPILVTDGGKTNFGQQTKTTLCLENLQNGAFIGMQPIRYTTYVRSVIEDGTNLIKLFKSLINNTVVQATCSLEVIGQLIININQKLLGFKLSSNVLIKDPIKLTVKDKTQENLQSELIIPTLNVFSGKSMNGDYLSISLFIHDKRDSIRGNINNDLGISAKISISDEIYNTKTILMKTKVQTKILRARPMFLKDLENYKLNYIDHMYDEIYETDGTSLENLSYYIL